MYDVRAAASRRAVGAPVWNWRAHGDVSCFHVRSERLVCGTCTGTVLVWSAGRNEAAGERNGDDYDGRLERKTRNKEKMRSHNPKIRGRFPKTNGFSNVKGFR